MPISEEARADPLARGATELEREPWVVEQAVDRSGKGPQVGGIVDQQARPAVHDLVAMTGRACWSTIRLTCRRSPR